MRTYFIKNEQELKGLACSYYNFVRDHDFSLLKKHTVVLVFPDKLIMLRLFVEYVETSNGTA